jgi:hypothetical protein
VGGRSGLSTVAEIHKVVAASASEEDPESTSAGQSAFMSAAVLLL